MAAYWITLRRQKRERLGFSAKTADQALATIGRLLDEGWNEVRVIDPNGDETSVYALQRAIETVKVGTV